ncbi:hypothetical protein [Paraflavitalea soli]|uniref:hypothetical protein n=1 Tax=Paraflavitalea soli TaxID=2315862 RepID=UPI001B85D698|nr:hypothetical protein [Paraflavitalea soli]
MRHSRGPRRFNERKAFMILACVVAFISLFSFIVMKLWNAILPDVLHVSTITFWQAMGILVLSKILFGGFGGWGHKKHEWKRKLNEKWQDMTPEERMKFKETLQNRFGRRWCPPGYDRQETRKDEGVKEQPGTGME